MRIIDVRGRGLTEQELTTIRAIGTDEYYVTYRTKPKRYLEIDYEVRAKSKEALRKKLDKISGFIETKDKVPIILPDEPDRTYYGEYASTDDYSEDNRRLHHLGRHRGTIFILRDPFKYGQEKELNFTDDSIIIDNKGTASAKPIIELTAKEKSTFAMISNGDEQYNLIGQPADVDEVLVDEKTQILYENGSTIDDWDYTSSSQGSFTQGSQGIQVGSYGSGSEWHGPRAEKEITPIQDFEVNMNVYVRTEQPNQTFRITANLYDENMNEIGMIRLWNKSTSRIRKVAEGRIGPYVGQFENYLISSRNYTIEGQRVWGGLLRFRRIGKTITMYVARISQRGNHIETDRKSVV